MPIQIEAIHKNTTTATETLKLIGERVLHDKGKGDWTVSVTFVDDPYIQRLNKDYLKRDYPTDVLAFPIDELDSRNGSFEKILGDMYISLDRAKDQSTDHQVPLEEEVARLMLHGLFHLLGYSHDEMSPLVEEYLTKFKNA